MGWFARLIGREHGALPTETRATDPNLDSMLWGNTAFSSQSVTGVAVNQYTALNATPVMACVAMLAEDVAKLPWTVVRQAAGEEAKEATDHFLYDLLQEPNEWMNGLEFREMIQLGLIMRGNGYAAILRDRRNRPLMLVPINPDWVALWVVPSGERFYRVTAADMHLRAILSQSAFWSETGMFPAEDMLHIRGFSSGGLLGASRIALAREAIALSLAQEQQAARWMGNGAKPSGMLSTDQKLNDDTKARLKTDIKENWTGLQNSGKMIIGEQGLKFQPFSMNSTDLEFIASRKYQVEEVARLFRIPLHMLASMDRSTNNNISQQAQEYVNYTLTGYTLRWAAKFSQAFNLRADRCSIAFDYSALTMADMTTRVNTWRTMVMSMLGTPDEGRIDLSTPFSPMPPKGGAADELQFPANMASAGSQSSGTAPDGAGRPAAQDSPA